MIELAHISKRFNYTWVFRDVDFEFAVGKTYAVAGPNGSGKSTLMKIIAGQLTPSSGSVTYRLNNNPVRTQDIFRSIAFAAPYLELIEEFTLKESIDFHGKFRDFADGIGTGEVIRILQMQKERNKPVRHFSSGMKQRLKLALSVLSKSPVLLLDEPGTNLDAQGMGWMQELVRTYAGDRIVIIASNLPEDLVLCEEVLDITHYRPPV